MPNRFQRFPLLPALAASLAAGAGLVALWRKHRNTRTPAPAPRHGAAFADHETDPENATQTRSAGPGAMRDGAQRRWDNVDEASDESFPASDPPAY
ncbi:hypothetical protein [Sphingopyxis indica]|uniref:Uncharacterized protein n=1 Tax=Sphingopyxis indica TaxID=436663 RepID=A0A239FMM1_9SPHN|nr:hypothetical protein [Sphingopyxis indica]WOF42351.1 hypothetical protein KNJ79_14265 [Sphingopyxis indica]SNS58139.1 hypothetical protein SAMN06295955_102159 [Sphingopyxis indica]